MTAKRDNEKTLETAKRTSSLRGPRDFCWCLFACLILGAAFSLYEPEYPREQFLNNLPALLFTLSLPFLWRAWNLSNRTILQLAAFTILHYIGAHWLYSRVPYDAWTESLFGFQLNEKMGWERNHFDRLVHFAFGLFVTLPIAEVCRKRARAGWGFSYFVSFLAINAISAFYEIVEWAVAVTASPEAAERYNGQQGDFFDAQKDMGLAFVASLLVSVLAFCGTKLRRT